MVENKKKKPYKYDKLWTFRNTSVIAMTFSSLQSSVVLHTSISCMSILLLIHVSMGWVELDPPSHDRGEREYPVEILLIFQIIEKAIPEKNNKLE